MLSRLFRRKEVVPSAPAASLPDGIRVYAVGDVHGRLDLLDKLMTAIDADNAARGDAETHFVFLGDLIDRGPESAGVLDRVISIAAERSDVTVLAGNHEEVFLMAFDGDREALRFFKRIGGRETILSYGIDRDTCDTSDPAELLRLLAAKVPSRHIIFLHGMKDGLTIGGYHFVHAGIRPGVALADQKQADLRWIRGEFLDHQGDMGFVVVHGHTPSETVEWRHNRIGIDTGAWDSGRLTALCLEGSEQWLIDTAPNDDDGPMMDALITTDSTAAAPGYAAARS